jgi:hypothetical protein
MLRSPLGEPRILGREGYILVRKLYKRRKSSFRGVKRTKSEFLYLFVFWPRHCGIFGILYLLQTIAVIGLALWKSPSTPAASCRDAG